MQNIARAIGLGYLALALLVTGLKAALPLGPLGYAPLALPLGPAARPVELVVWHSTDKRAWMEEAARRFEAGGATAAGRPVRVRLVALGSGEMADRVARQDWGGSPPPAALSPASSLWVDLLRAGGSVVEGSPQPLALSPLVALAWAERAELLWPAGGAGFWQQLAAAAVDDAGWAGVAAQRGFAADSPEARAARGWGFVKFGHASPARSNSGAQTLILLAYAYHEKAGGLSAADLLDPGFQRWLEGLERAALDFGPSSAGLATSMAQFGPSRYDVVMLPENLAIEALPAAQQRWGQPARVYYPPATLFSDHPFITLGAPLTGPDERAAAAAFDAFLRSRPMQELALSFGLRPADAGVSIGDGRPDNPFVRYAPLGLQADIAQQVEAPPADVAGGLLELWRRQIEPLTIAPRQ